MVFLAFLNMAQVRMVLEWLDPSVKGAQREVDMVEVGFCILNFKLFTFLMLMTRIIENTLT